MQKTSGVYSILLLFSELFAAAVKMEQNRNVYHLYYKNYIIFASLYVWKGLSFLCQIFVFSCIQFTTCTLLHTTQLFKKLDFYHFDSLLLSTLLIHNSIWNSQSSYSILKKSVRTRKTWFDTPLILVRNPNCRRGPFAVSVYCQWVVTSLPRKWRIALNVLIWHF